MRMSEFATKEIINLADGSRLGQVGDAELLIDEETGRIETILVWPRRKGAGELVIPWSAVRQIGPEVLIVDLRPGDPPLPRVPRAAMPAPRERG
ncbi:PRC domain-containing protein [Candidatus Hydrogenisulfobacillus filiaventi]|uniref:PRC domain-containing protein n=1 Tax=Candidatus Hydrogenisulfobacillus filiaventi TaxID=2707344 RepID=A0A6F8ZH75_9FIRM|nr:YlmC/YmxH family sporulation protein [Bacillota bacterium]CAB1129029.1 PRC domain-containing protein [Candidatus Hydrogenisulfobacillus filiaventi]